MNGRGLEKFFFYGWKNFIFFMDERIWYIFSWAKGFVLKNGKPYRNMKPSLKKAKKKEIQEKGCWTASLRLCVQHPFSGILVQWFVPPCSIIFWFTAGLFCFISLLHFSSADGTRNSFHHLNRDVLIHFSLKRYADPLIRQSGYYRFIIFFNMIITTIRPLPRHLSE